MMKKVRVHANICLLSLRVSRFNDRKYHKGPEDDSECDLKQIFHSIEKKGMLPVLTEKRSEEHDITHASVSSSKAIDKQPTDLQDLCPKVDSTTPSLNSDINTARTKETSLLFFDKSDIGKISTSLLKSAPRELFRDFSSYIYHFIQNETKVISRALKISDKAMPMDASVYHLDESIQNKLMDQVDDYNRFVVLLSHHPLDVPYGMLLQYYARLPRIATTDKHTLIKCLVFHNAWNELWVLILSDDANLTGIEEAVDEIVACLVSQRNLDIGIWLALSAAKQVAASKKLYLLIRELFEYKLHIPKKKMILFSHVNNVQPNEPFLMAFPKGQRDAVQDYPDLKAFALIKYSEQLLHTHSMSKSITEVCKADPRLDKVPGFVSVALREFGDPHLVRFFSTRRSTMRNELDLYFLVKDSPADKYYQIFLSICYSYKKKHITNDYVINLFVMKSHLVAQDVFHRTMRKFYRRITIENLSHLVTFLLNHREGREILRTMNRRQHDKFSTLVQKITNTQQDSRILLLLLELSSSKGRSTIRQILKSFGSENEYMEYFLDYEFTEYNLTEIWRYGVRENLLDETNAGCLFQKVLSKSWNANALHKRSGYSHNCLGLGNFREQYSHATVAERRRLRARLQAMAQALSEADAPQIALTISFLRSYLHGDEESMLFQDSFGRNHILDHFVKYTMKFIHRSSNTGAGVSKMKEVLKSLDFDSTEMQTSIYEYMTFDNPKISLEILKMCKMKPAIKSKPMIKAIERGILTSRHLEKRERLLFFQNFQREKAVLGFGRHIYAQSMALMGNLIFDIADKTNEASVLKSFMNTAYSSGVPARIIKKWSSKV